jgi:hypothetical protein
MIRWFDKRIKGVCVYEYTLLNSSLNDDVQMVVLTGCRGVFCIRGRVSNFQVNA